MRTFQEMYETLVDMARTGYEKLGWDHEHAPMIFLFREPDGVDLYLVPANHHLGRQEFMDALASLHRKMAGVGVTAALVIEAWMREDLSREDVELHKQGLSLENDPRRQEALQVNIRRGGEQRIGTVRINREHKRLTPMPLLDPADGNVKGRFVGPRP